ncbi:MAG: hypothetical protein B6I28_06165 [Fusobacteriia bacterium 4572_132]|nr:MAG: hypothetical protein B6I28_06165 [Fusobacteriia bacterium 4572_132]
MKKENITIEGHIGTWYVIGKDYHNGKSVYLLEHEKYGEDAPHIIVDKNYNVIRSNVHNGFDDLRY